MKMERIVATRHVEAWVGLGGQKPSPDPLVSLGLGIVPGISPRGIDMLVIEMTPAQASDLVRAIQARVDQLHTEPEGTE